MRARQEQNNRAFDDELRKKYDRHHLLDKVFLRNFKAFAAAEVKLAPLTLIYGQNSSGKSSVITALEILGRGLQTLAPGHNALAATRWIEQYRDVTYEKHRHRHDPTEMISFEVKSRFYEALWMLPATELTAPEPAAITPLGQWGIRELVDDGEPLEEILIDFNFHSDLVPHLASDSDSTDFTEFGASDLDLYINHFFVIRRPTPESVAATLGDQALDKILVFEPRATPEELHVAAEIIREAAGKAGIPGDDLHAEELDHIGSAFLRDIATVQWFAVRRLVQTLLFREAYEDDLALCYAEALADLNGSISPHPGPEDVEEILGWWAEFSEERSWTYRLLNQCAEEVERTFIMGAGLYPRPVRERDDRDIIFCLLVGQAICKVLDREFFQPREDWLAHEANALWTHIGPTRALVRDGAELQAIDERNAAAVGVDGSSFPHVLAEHPELIDGLNAWLEQFGTGYTYTQRADVIRPTAPARYGQKDLLASIQLLDTRRSGEDGEPIVVGFEDVGYGISQITPIIVQLLAPMGQNALVTIEQPELHIHPRLQTELAELFIHASSLERGDERKQLVIETHSEHILLRVQRRIREKTLSHEDVAVLYVDVDKDGTSQVQRLRMNENGSFIDEWPDGFFGERLMELLSM